MSKAEHPRTRRPYKKPQVHRVELAPGEAVLSSCKSVSGFIPTWIANWCNAIVQCMNVGS